MPPRKCIGMSNHQISPYQEKCVAIWSTTARRMTDTARRLRNFVRSIREYCSKSGQKKSLPKERIFLGLFALCYPSQRPSGYLMPVAKAMSNADSRTQSVLGNRANNPSSIIPLWEMRATVDYSTARIHFTGNIDNKSAHKRKSPAQTSPEYFFAKKFLSPRPVGLRR